MNYLLCSVLGFRILDWALLLSAYCAYPSTRILKRMNKTGQFRATEQCIGFQRTIFLRSGFFEGQATLALQITLNSTKILYLKTHRLIGLVFIQKCFYDILFVTKSIFCVWPMRYCLISWYISLYFRSQTTRYRILSGRRCACAS